MSCPKMDIIIVSDNIVVLIQRDILIMEASPICSGVKLFLEI